MTAEPDKPESSWCCFASVVREAVPKGAWRQRSERKLELDHVLLGYLCLKKGDPTELILCSLCRRVLGVSWDEQGAPR